MRGKGATTLFKRSEALPKWLLPMYEAKELAEAVEGRVDLLLSSGTPGADDFLCGMVLVARLTFS